MSTFVTVGNARQPFRRLLDVVAAHLALLPHPVVVQHGHTPFVAPNCRTVDFLSMQEYADHIAQARVLIMHAGAGSLIHAIEAGKRPIVMPRLERYGEHVNDHQMELASALAQQRRVVLIASGQELVGALRIVLSDRPDSRSRRSQEAGGRMVDLLRETLSQLARQEK
ncbi:MAG: hypothetical protein HXY29_00040 [Rhodocyclaceae bacterium]|jgi:beta-1,4-N-acetylglucosaminyltransferase|nr:hypothetical protein [Rhodocyclaceae bacterium]